MRNRVSADDYKYWYNFHELLKKMNYIVSALSKGLRCCGGLFVISFLFLFLFLLVFLVFFVNLACADGTAVD